MAEKVIERKGGYSNTLAVVKTADQLVGIIKSPIKRYEALLETREIGGRFVGTLVCTDDEVIYFLTALTSETRAVLMDEGHPQAEWNGNKLRIEDGVDMTPTTVVSVLERQIVESYSIAPGGTRQINIAPGIILEDRITGNNHNLSVLVRDTENKLEPLVNAACLFAKITCQKGLEKIISIRDATLVGNQRELVVYFKGLEAIVGESGEWLNNFSDDELNQIFKITGEVNKFASLEGALVALDDSNTEKYRVILDKDKHNSRLLRFTIDPDYLKRWIEETSQKWGDSILAAVPPEALGREESDRAICQELIDSGITVNFLLKFLSELHFRTNTYANRLYNLSQQAGRQITPNTVATVESKKVD